MLVPDLSSTEVTDAARLAIRHANSRPGFNRGNFELVVRNTEGPWGAGSKESVSLVYEDSVWAILGSLDGRNAHLAEQVAAKSHITYMETRATDPTLTQAFVPWFFRCAPSDDQQSTAILDNASDHVGRAMAILVSDDYDSNIAAKSFTRISSRSEENASEIFVINSDQVSPLQIIDQLKRSKAGFLVITIHTKASMEILREVRKMMPELPVYGTHTFLSGIELGDTFGKEYEGMILASSVSLVSTAGLQFQKAYTVLYDKKPKLPEFLAYDGMNLILTAIQNGGWDREAIKDHLSEINDTGASGFLSFDEHGNRKGPVGLIQIRKGLAVPLK